MSVIHIPPRPTLDLRIVAFPAAMSVLLSVLFFRLWYIQVVKAPELAESAAATRKDVLSRPAPRGLIYDRNGNLLAGLRPELVVTIVYSTVAKNKGELEALATKLGTTTKALKSKIDNAKHSPGLPSPLIVGVDPQIATSIAESQSEFPGVGVDLSPTRYYPEGPDYPHVLGIVRLPSKRDKERLKEKGLTPAQYVGSSGLERSFEAELMGVPGDEVMEVDSKRRPVRILQRDNPVPGKDLILSIDSGLQHFATEYLKQKKYKAAVVALVPKTGEVLCMVSSPTFDPNLFESRMSPATYAKIVGDPDSPLDDRAIDGKYSPGSTFKIVTSLAAYESGKFDPHRAFNCPGYFQLGGRKFACLGHHGEITFKNALEKSCNTYFSNLGYLAGKDALRKAALEAGLGQPTGIEISGESIGLVPSVPILKRVFKNNKFHWYGGQTVLFSIGQGYLTATPLQMCDVAAMVANEGTIYKPHLVRAIRDTAVSGKLSPIKPEVLHQVPNVSHEFWETMKEALVGVVQNGTARQAQIPNVEWGGKTGSTEHGHHSKDGNPVKTHSWFIGFAPAKNPQIAICVFVEDAGHGGDISAPIAKDMVEKYLNRQAEAAKALAKTPRSASISALAVSSPSAR